MKQFTNDMLAAIDRNYDYRALADRLNAISARRKRRSKHRVIK